MLVLAQAVISQPRYLLIDQLSLGLPPPNPPHPAR